MELDICQLQLLRSVLIGELANANKYSTTPEWITLIERTLRDIDRMEDELMK